MFSGQSPAPPRWAKASGPGWSRKAQRRHGRNLGRAREPPSGSADRYGDAVSGTTGGALRRAGRTAPTPRCPSTWPGPCSPPTPTPPSTPTSSLAGLDDLAAGCRTPTLDGLLHHLFVDQGFVGNQDDYYDPANSYLDDVLDRHLGIPITLAVLTMEVGPPASACPSPASACPATSSCGTGSTPRSSSTRSGAASSSTGRAASACCERLHGPDTAAGPGLAGAGRAAQRSWSGCWPTWSASSSSGATPPTCCGPGTCRPSWPGPRATAPGGLRLRAGLN